jgi:hypothetical protein
MSSYYQCWVEMTYWRLLDAVKLVCEYTTLLEGHDTPVTYSISLVNNMAKCHAHIENDFLSNDNDGLSGIASVLITEHNEQYFSYDSNGDVIHQVDYANSVVDKAEFIVWAAKHKFKIPNEFMQLIEASVVGVSDEIGIIRAAMNAGIICESYGSQIRREDLQRKVNSLSKILTSKMDMIWDEVPERYKLGKGESLKSVERAIKAAILVGMEFENMKDNNLHTSVLAILKKSKLEIESEHFGMIMKALTPSKS